MERIIRWIKWTWYKFNRIKTTVNFTWWKINDLLKFKKINKKVNYHKKKIGFLVWITLASTAKIAANHCRFESTHWFTDVQKWSLSKNVWWLKKWNDIEKVFVQKWWDTKAVKKSKLKINETDKLKLTKSNQLCVYSYVDYNFKKFSSGELLEYVKEVSKENNIDYRYVLSVMHQESKFVSSAKSPTWAKWFGQLTWIAIKEINRLYWLKHSIGEVKSDEKLNINYSIKYLALMIKRHWSIKRGIKYYNWDKKEMNNYVKVVLKNYKKIYSKMEA